jgi:[ribosomal protein S18]-alanine N-acetyltransferase
VRWPFQSDGATIRPLIVADSEFCAALHKIGFAHSWSAAEFESLLGSPAVDGSAAILRNGAGAGFVLARSAAVEAEILTIVVRPDRRRRGLGRELLRFQLGRLASCGVEEVFLEVDESNAAARSLYEQLGFSPVGARPAYYRRSGGAASAALVLRCVL